MTKPKRELFLEALRAGWTVANAATRSGFARQRFYELRESDETFAQEWDEAIESGTQVLEDELHRRAMEGWDEETFDGDGALMRRVRRYSPALLIFSLKARKPDVYRDIPGRLEVTGPGGGPLQMQPGYTPPTLSDMVALAGELGVLGRLGYSRSDVVDGEAHEVVAELPAAENTA